MSLPPIHAIILTKNESMHIKRCIESIVDVCETITVIDSGSTDDTVSIAEGLGATAVFNPWVNYATQLNYGIDLLKDRGGWLFRIDADEVLQGEAKANLSDTFSKLDDNIDGLTVLRRIYFRGKRIRYGSIEPSHQLRLWQNNKGRCEQRWMDEHIIVQGKVLSTKVVLSDINLNSLTWWTEKHNHYASREAIDSLNGKYGFLTLETSSRPNTSAQAKMKRFLKEKVYFRLSNGLRSILYFLYRYIIRLGFLDGRKGWYFHFLQAFWYRTLVDAKVDEIEDYAADNNVSIPDAIKSRTGIDLRADTSAVK